MTQEKTFSVQNYLMGFASRNRMTILLYLLVVVLFVIGEIVSKGFMSPQHIGTILRTASFLGIAAIGQTLVILTGGIDLSVGPLITMGNVFICMLMNGKDANNLWAIAVIILIGIAFGVINGLGVNYLRISPLVMTLAVGSLVTGFTLIYSQGAPKGESSPLLHQIGVGFVFGSIPIMVVVWALMIPVVLFLLHWTVYGRKLMYCGANPKAANLSGINVPVVKTIAYVIGGVTAILSGVFMAGYTEQAFLGIGNDYVMWSITAVVIGGTSLTGGKGGYVGTIAGAIIMVLLEAILTVIRIPEAGRIIANGLIILIMIAIYFRKPRN